MKIVYHRFEKLQILFMNSDYGCINSLTLFNIKLESHERIKIKLASLSPGQVRTQTSQTAI